MTGFETAAHEIELVLFTTLGPSGAIAFVFLLGRAWMEKGERRRCLEKALGVTLVLVIVGLIASAAHLGTPSNALYVLTRVGKSPLSNEMAALVLFLGLGATFWLYSFARTPNRRLQGTIACMASVAAVVFVAFVGFAYSADTIITWSSPASLASLWLTALVGGPLLALCIEGVALPDQTPRLALPYLTVSGASLLASLVSMAMQYEGASGLANYMVTFEKLVPHFWWMFIAYLACCAGGIALAAAWSLGGWGGAVPQGPSGAIGKGGTGQAMAASWPRGLRYLMCVGAVALALAGIFVMRFEFYMTHMTIGLGA